MLALSAYLTGLFLEDTRLQILSPKADSVSRSLVSHRVKTHRRCHRLLSYRLSGGVSHGLFNLTGPGPVCS